MKRPGIQPLGGHFGVIAFISTLAIATGAHHLIPDDATAIHLYTLPAAIGAARFGVRLGMQAWVLVVGVAVGNTLLGGTGGAEFPWAGVCAWAAVAAVTVWIVGSLRDRRRRSAHDTQMAHLAFRDVFARQVLTVTAETDSVPHRTAELSVTIARSLGANQRAQDEIHTAAWLAELGTSDTTLDVLARAVRKDLRPNARSDDKIISEHDGYLERVAGIIACLRERWDGEGRLGLMGEAIPLGSRVIAVANRYVCATHNGGAVRGGVAALLRHEHGKTLDPAIVDAVLDLRIFERAAVAGDGAARQVQAPRLDLAGDGQQEESERYRRAS